MTQRLALCAMVLLLLAACGPSNKIGSSVTGKREAILDQSRKVEADKSLGAKPQLPPIEVVKAWPQAGYSTSHKMPNAAVDLHPKKIWSSNIGAGSSSDAKLLAQAVSNGSLIFTIDTEGMVRAFDAKSGERKWEFDTTPPERDGDAMGGGVGYDQGVLYATTGFGEVVALDAANGTIKWRKQLMNPIRAAPSIANGQVYAVTIDNQLQALDAKTGTIKWHHRGIAENATLMGASNPAVSTDEVIVAYSSGEIFNLRPENGRVAWSYTLTVPTQVGAMPAIADIHGLPVVEDGRIYAVSHSGRIAAIDERTGDRAWEADIGGVNTPLVTGNTVFALSNDSQLVALARDSGRVMWVQSLQKFEDPEDRDSDRVFWVGPVLAANRLWLGNSLGQLVEFDAAEGKQLDMIDLGKPIYIPPSITNNIMYVVLDNGTLVALK